eukprot:CAMPEP_0113492344 /NCGR_PEP_ID=MMETSP0014_2-20120614/28025_1 /TAXON_ID=2857 /ORGANISM="Nitzschia sp." /LENGTH=429 /DNA_ID=CAMNT_0000386167 /DNA_START=950 /DNA_END=2235 /DNA_ORIENTATION=+ /assembly_acc=CAM_ASM_000159
MNEDDESIEVGVRNSSCTTGNDTTTTTTTTTTTSSHVGRYGRTYLLVGVFGILFVLDQFVFTEEDGLFGTSLLSPSTTVQVKETSGGAIDSNTNSWTTWWSPYLRSSNNTDHPWRKPNEPYSWCTPSPFQNKEIPVIKDEGHIFRGLLYAATPKTSSSTSQGVNVRIARRLGQRFLSNHHDCEHHNNARYLFQKRYVQRDIDRSYLWSLVRDPRRRDLSQVYHFHVSKRNMTTDDDTIIGALTRLKGYQTMQLHHDPQIKNQLWRDVDIFPIEDQLVEFVDDEVLEKYDFLGVVERMDESLAVLSILLDVTAEDVIVLSAKQSGGYDATRECFHIEKAQRTPRVEEYFASETFVLFNPDLYLIDAVNEKLDRTIESIGFDKVQQRVETIQVLRELADEACQSTVIYPCSSEGVPQHEQASQNCYLQDSG